MSASYFIYTEVKINDEWHCINGLMPKFKYNWGNHKYENEYEYELAETYYNGSRSYFGEAYNKLRDIGYGGKFIEMSKELQPLYASSIEDEKEGVDSWWHPIFIDYDCFKKYVNPDKFDSHGLVHKNTLFAWENGDAEELWAVDHEELAELTEEEKRAYVYYEWDNPWDWHYYFKIINRYVESQLNAFCDLNGMFNDDYQVRLVFIGG